MFVHGCDAGWLSHPFWRGKFALTDAARIEEIKASGLQDCWIDTSKGIDVPADASPPRPAVAARPAGARTLDLGPPASVSMADELKQAARLRARSAQAMRHLFSEVRLGN